MPSRSWILIAALWVSIAALGRPVRTLLNENRMEEGLEICRQFEQLAGYDRDMLLSCAWIYLRLDKIQSADAIQKRIKDASTLPEAQIIAAYAKTKTGQFDDALSRLEDVERQNSGSPIALSAQEMKAELYEARGQMDTAAFIYKQIVGVDGRRARSHWGLGRYYLAKGDNRRAITHLTETTKLWPKHIGSRFNLGILYLSQNDLSQAARWLSQCYNLNRADTGVLEQLGNLFEKRGNTKEALRHWQKAMDLGSTSPAITEKMQKHFILSIENLIQENKFTEALAKLQGALGIYSKEPKLSLWRGVVYRNLGKYKKASGELLAFLQSEPNDATGLRELGICYINLSLPDQAFKALEAAVQKDPADGYNQAWYAYILESKGELERARDHWNRAIARLKDSKELEKAVRRVAAIEKKLREKTK